MLECVFFCRKIPRTVGGWGIFILLKTSVWQEKRCRRRIGPSRVAIRWWRLGHRCLRKWGSRRGIWCTRGSWGVTCWCCLAWDLFPDPLLQPLPPLWTTSRWASSPPLFRKEMPNTNSPSILWAIRYCCMFALHAQCLSFCELKALAGYIFVLFSLCFLTTIIVKLNVFPLLSYKLEDFWGDTWTE